jgi:hypothetical protein
MSDALCPIDDTFYLIDPSWYDVNEQGLLAEPRLPTPD